MVEPSENTFLGNDITCFKNRTISRKKIHTKIKLTSSMFQIYPILRVVEHKEIKFARPESYLV